MIRVNGQYLELNQQASPIAFAVDFMDIQKANSLNVEGVVSFTVNIPRTNTNQRILGHYSPIAERQNIFDYEFAPNGQFQHSGKLRITSRSSEQIELLLTTGNSEWINEARELNAHDVDLGQRFFDADEVIEQHEAESNPEVAYPFLRLFGDAPELFFSLKVDNFKPTPNLRNFFDKAFAKIGYQFNPVGKMKFIDRLHLFRGTPTDANIDFEDAATEFDTDNPLFEWGGGGQAVQGNFTSYLIPIPINSITLDQGDNLTTDTYTHLNEPVPSPTSGTATYVNYNTELGSVMSVNLSLNFRCLPGTTMPNNNGMPLRIQAIKGAYPGDGNQRITNPDIPAPSPTDFEVLSEKLINYTGQIGNFFAPLPVEFESITLPDFVLPAGESFFLAYRFDDWTLQYNGGLTLHMQVYKQNITIDVVPTLVTEGLFYKLEKAMPSKTLGELLSEVVQNFNGIIDTEDGVVNLYNRDEWYLDETEDWTDKIDATQTPLLNTIQDVSKKLNYRYLFDENDVELTRFERDNDVEYGYAQKVLNDPSLTGETEATDKIDYALAIEQQYPQTVLAVYRSGEEADDFRNTYRTSDRMFFNAGRQGHTWKLVGVDETTTLNTYTNMTTEALRFEDLFPQFFQRTFDLINNGELLVADVRLTAADIVNLNYRKAKLLQLEDGNIVKGWINKIEDLRPGERTTTKIEFIIER